MGNDTDFRFLAENSPDILCRFGLDRRMQYVSPSSLAVLGWTPEEILAMPPFALVVPEDVPMLVAAIERDLTPGAVPEPITVRNFHKNGSVLWMEVAPRIVRDPTTEEVIEMVLILRDISRHKLLEQQLTALAMTDSFTGLANRRAFDEALSREWQRTLHDGSRMSLLLLDVDHFKQFNDTHGHLMGDDCLRAIAHAVRTAACRTIDTVSRYGGEELAVILPSTDCDEAMGVAEKIRQAIVDLGIHHAQNTEHGNAATVSIGIATALALHGGTFKMPEGLLLSADHALYRAKQEGRNPP